MWSHGTTATITGTGFGVKNPAAPLVWAPLRNSLNPISGSRVTAWNEPTKAQLAVTNGMQLARWNMRRDTGWPPLDGSNAFQIRLPTPPNNLYLRGKHYLAFDPVAAGGMNHKMWRAIPDALEGGRINWYANWHHVAGGDGRVGIESAAEQRWNDRLYPHSQWNTEEWIYRKSTPGVRDGRLAFLMNNQDFGDLNPCLNTTATDTGITTFGMQDDLTNVTLQPETPEWWAYYRDLYYDDTYARVVVGNAATYAACTQTEIQIPIAWSDTQITVGVNLGSFESLAGYWIYVFDSSNTIVHSEQIPGYSQALGLAARGAGQTRSYLLPVPVGATSVSIRFPRTAGATTANEIIRVTMQYTLDGSTWSADHHAGIKGGDLTLLRNGNVAVNAEATFNLPQPNNPNRQIQGLLHYLSPVTCGLDYRFD